MSNFVDIGMVDAADDGEAVMKLREVEFAVDISYCDDHI